MSESAKFALWNGGFGIAAAVCGMIAKNCNNSTIATGFAISMIVLFLIVTANPFDVCTNDKNTFT